MPIRIPWDRFEVALLFQMYEKVINGADLNIEAVKLSKTLRKLAIQRGITIDDTYRNVNGMKMQFRNVQYLFTNGKHGLSGASPLIRETFRLYKYVNNVYQATLKEAIQLTEMGSLVDSTFSNRFKNKIRIKDVPIDNLLTNSTKDKITVEELPIEKAFFNYTKDKTKLSPEQLTVLLKKATEFCQLKQPLLGISDVNKVRKVQQRVIEGKLLKFKYGKDAQGIQIATNLYFAFIIRNNQNSPKMPANSKEGEVSKSPVTKIIIDPHDKRLTSLEGFKTFLKKEAHFVEGSSKDYCKSLLMIEEYIIQNKLGCSVLNATAVNVKSIIDLLMAKPDFIEINVKQHQQLGRVLKQYAAYLRKNTGAHDNSSVNYGKTCFENTSLPDKRWQIILKEDFPDGYILNDIVSQLQAVGFWEKRYGEACPLSGSAIDVVMKDSGNVRDGRVFVKSEADGILFERICDEISEILEKYSAVYRSCIYERYSSQLTKFSIYTEPVMTQQLVSYAKGRFYNTGNVFAKKGKTVSLVEDCRQVLQNNGGAMSIEDISKELWFVPYEAIHHNLMIDKEALSLDNGIWMLAEFFPLTTEDALKVANMLDEYFVSQNFVRQAELLPLLRQYLPSIADNLSGFHFTAIFKILNYYLKDRFSFSKAIIAPKGAKQDFRDLFQRFVKEHDQFTLDDLSVFASDLNVPIYWEHIYIGGAVRINNDEFVNKNKISFDIQRTDKVLENFCTGDYLPFLEVSPSMMMHLPTCGYQWNGYLLFSYVLRFSKTFRAYYNSLSKTGYFGAMVKQSCNKIKSYEDLVERILTVDDTWVTTDDALTLLVNRGIQAQKRFKGIEQIVVKARQNKLLD